MKRALGRSVWAVGRWLPLFGLGAVAWLAFTGRAEGGPADDDGAPQGEIAFFTGGACPAGWTTAATVQGRLVVAVADGGSAGVQVGSPLGDQEDRQHRHTYTGMVTLAPKNIAAADGSNNSGAASQAYTVTGTTDMAASSLPSSRCSRA